MNVHPPLPKKESLFCYFFHLFRQGEQAAISAGYPPDLASAQAARLLQRRDISRQIAALDRRQYQPKLQHDVIAGFQRLAFGSVADPIRLMFHQPDHPPLDLDRLDLFTISKIKRHKDGSLEMEFVDRFKALVELAHIAEQNTDQSEVGSIFRALETSAKAMDAPLFGHETDSSADDDEALL